MDPAVNHLKSLYKICPSLPSQINNFLIPYDQQFEFNNHIQDPQINLNNLNEFIESLTNKENNCLSEDSSPAEIQQQREKLQQEKEKYIQVIAKLSNENQNLEIQKAGLLKYLFNLTKDDDTDNTQEIQDFKYQLNNRLFLNYEFMKKYLTKSDEFRKTIFIQLELQNQENKKLQAQLEKIQKKLKKQRDQFQSFLVTGFSKPEQPQKIQQITEQLKQEQTQPEKITNIQNSKLSIDTNTKPEEIKLQNQNCPFKETNNEITVTQAMDLESMQFPDSISIINMKQSAITPTAGKAKTLIIEKARQTVQPKQAKEEPIKQRNMKSTKLQQSSKSNLLKSTK